MSKKDREEQSTKEWINEKRKLKNFMIVSVIFPVGLKLVSLVVDINMNNYINILAVVVLLTYLIVGTLGIYREELKAEDIQGIIKENERQRNPKKLSDIIKREVKVAFAEITKEEEIKYRATENHPVNSIPVTAPTSRLDINDLKNQPSVQQPIINPGPDGT